MSEWLMAAHVVNFIAPALGLGCAMGLLDAIFMKKRPLSPVFIASSAIYFLCAIAVLTLGLALIGRDGKVLTWMFLVAALGTLAAWRQR